MLLPLLFSVASQATLVPWLYQEVENRGPSHWGLIKGPFNRLVYPSCAGKSQSPIQIYNTKGTEELHEVKFEYQAVNTYTVENQQQGVKYTVEGAGFIRDGNQKGKRYNWTAVEVHTPAEHVIGGTQFDLEVQFKHTAVDQSVDGLPAAQKTIVVSVLFEIRGGANPSLSFLDEIPSLPDPLFGNYDDAYHNITFNSSAVSGGKTLDPSKLLLDKGYYSYVGSQTTPPCTEDVKWFVMSKVNRVGAAQVEAFKNVMMFAAAEAKAVTLGLATSSEVTGNARPTQALGTRTVASFTPAPSPIAIFDDDDDDAYILGLIGTCVSCFSLCLLLVFILCYRKSNDGHQPLRPEQQFPKQKSEPDFE